MCDVSVVSCARGVVWWQSIKRVRNEMKCIIKLVIPGPVVGERLNLTKMRSRQREKVVCLISSSLRVFRLRARDSVFPVKFERGLCRIGNA